MRVVPLEAFRDKLSFAVAVHAVERGFRALALGEATLPDPMVVELAAQQAEVHVKAAHLRGARHIVLKLATGFYQNRARGLPSGDGLFLLLDAETGARSEEHTSELQSLAYLVCRLLLEKKKKPTGSPALAPRAGSTRTH